MEDRSTPVFAWHVDGEALPGGDANPGQPPPARRAGRVALLTGALLVAFALGAGTGVVIATLVVRDTAAPVEREDRRGAVVTPSPPAPVSVQPAGSSPPARPRRPAPRAVPRPVEDAAVAPAPAVERDAPTGRAAVEDVRPSPPVERRAPESP